MASIGSLVTVLAASATLLRPAPSRYILMKASFSGFFTDMKWFHAAR